MADQSLITDEVRAFIGRSTGPQTVTITEDAVFRAMEAYQGSHPAAIEAGDPVPGFVLVNMLPGGEDIRIPDLLPRSLLVSNEFTIERPIRMGERFTATARVADINERLGGQFGHGLYVRTETEFVGEDGAVAGRTASTLMYYDPAGARRDTEGGR
jgi:hypothetical protein